MKKLILFLFIASELVLGLGMAGCSKDDDNSAKTDYADLIRGHWSSVISDSEKETISIDSQGAGSILFYDLIHNDWGIMARGTYTLNGNTISATYDRVQVNDENYNSTTWHGFTNGKAQTVEYTIVSCDGKKLVLKKDNGETRDFEKYKDIE
uniref:hypothetical protein n=1 Tax=Candidatus Cryptobacteroides bacterium TaxID=3085639 RepID=UPI004026FC23